MLSVAVAVGALLTLLAPPTVATAAELQSVEPTVSALAAQGVDVPPSLTYGLGYSLKGTVTSNAPIEWVRVRIVDRALGVEVDRTIRSGDTSECAGLAFDLSSVSHWFGFPRFAIGPKTITVTAKDGLAERTVYCDTFTMVGPGKYATFWRDRASRWAYPLKRSRYIMNGFATVRSGGRRHAAVDLKACAGDGVYAMAPGVVEYVFRGNYYAGTGAVQVKHSDGSVILYGEVRPGSTIRIGTKVRKGQRIASVQRNSCGRAMLHLEAYSGKATGKLTQRGNYRYDNVTARRFDRRRDLIHPAGVIKLPVVR